MKHRIRKAAVLGAGVMGSQIAAHLANVGIPSYVLDTVPTSLTPDEQGQGLTLDHPMVRNRLARQGLERARQAQPAAFYTPELAALITPGNMQDHLHWLVEADWVIEAVPERPEVKAEVYRAIAPHLQSAVILSSNTSGLSLTSLGQALPEPLQSRFLGTHFFNPPRYLKLLEIIPTSHTDREVLDTMLHVGRRVLGKGVVQAKDTPNFIANRIGVYGLLCCMQVMAAEGYTISEVDTITGEPLGRPKSATFRTADLVGLDTVWHVARNTLTTLLDDPLHEVIPEPNFLAALVERGWLGTKTGQGFYKPVPTETGRAYYELNYRTFEYQPQGRLRSPAFDLIRGVEDVRQRLNMLAYAEDRAGILAWRVLSATLRYAAACLPDIAADVVQVDNALKWGFNWELGPFETWDALGVEAAARKMHQDGQPIPAVVTALLDAGHTSFYRQQDGPRSYFDLPTRSYVEAPQDRRCLTLAVLKQQNRVMRANPGASLIDLGEGVACVEFHTKMNVIGGDIVDMLLYAVDQAGKRFDGLVIGNTAEQFSAGANLALLLLEAQNEDWDAIDQMVRTFQETTQALQYADVPVVAAPAGMTLAGGCEICLAADRICAAAETYMGLVEVGVGLVPAGGGCKELLRRHQASLPADVHLDLFPLVQRVFQTIGLAKVSTSAAEARAAGLLSARDLIVINRDYLLFQARQAVQALLAEEYAPPRPARIRACGRSGYGNLLAALYNMETAGFLSSYDRRIGQKLAYVLCGGDVPDGSTVSEQHLLDLEREAFLSLCGEPKTQERMRHMLERHRPLRN